MADLTARAIQRQLAAMRCERFDLGIGDIVHPDGQMERKPYENMAAEQVLKSVGFLRHCNAVGKYGKGPEDIYIKPAASLDRALILADDVRPDELERMKQRGLRPCLVIQSSPAYSGRPYPSLQAWLDFGPAPMPVAERTCLAKEIAARFHCDPNTAEGVHFGRLAGVTNNKPKYRQPNGYAPYVLVLEATPGLIVTPAEQSRAWAHRRVLKEAEKAKAASAVSQAPTVRPGPPQYQRTDGRRMTAAEAWRAYVAEWQARPRWHDDGTLDWSEGEFYAACRMAKGGYGQEEIEACIRDHAEGRGKPRAERYATHTAQKAMARAQYENRQSRTANGDGPSPRV